MGHRHHRPRSLAAIGARALTRLVTSPKARCTSPRPAADWFPDSEHADQARRQAAAAIAECHRCPVRAACLEYCFRGITDPIDLQELPGVWAGLLPDQLRNLFPRWQAGIDVMDLLWPIDEDETDTAA